jgi:hypothetical protein
LINICFRSGLSIPGAKETSDQLSVNEGMNRFVWDMYYPGGEKIPGMLLWNGFVEGPKASPGNYTARIRYDHDSIDVAFVIKGDPNYKITEADYDAQIGFLLQVRDKFNEIQKSHPAYPQHQIPAQ